MIPDEKYVKTRRFEECFSVADATDMDLHLCFGMAKGLTILGVEKLYDGSRVSDISVVNL